MPETRRLAIVGYGKMGRLIEQLAPEYGFAVALKLDEFNNAELRGHHARRTSAAWTWRSSSPFPRRWWRTWSASRRWA